jgi:cyclopropane fatty-acyl-phospholipid synthase-like methyltransferase
MKNLFSGGNVDYSPEGRKKRAYQYAELCKLLVCQGITVVCCAITMFEDVRKYNRRHIPNYREIYIEVDFDTVVKMDAKGNYKKFAKGKDAMVGFSESAELPTNPDVVIHNNMEGNIEQYVDKILQETANLSEESGNYWDTYYKNGGPAKAESDFAKFALGSMEQGKKLIDLGCGNGRDSRFFCTHGLKVTAVDSSAEAIASVEGSMPLFAICDDFVKARTLFCVDYDYCYARWSFDEISQMQQDELLPSIYSSLKEGGLLFVEAHTINDAKYGQGTPLDRNEYISDNHYQRFIDPAAFVAELRNIGFEIVFSEEAEEFSLTGDNTPPHALVRVVARK